MDDPFEDYPMALAYIAEVLKDIGMATQRQADVPDLSRVHREMAIVGAERLLRTLKRIKP